MPKALKSNLKVQKIAQSGHTGVVGYGPQRSIGTSQLASNCKSYLVLYSVEPRPTNRTQKFTHDIPIQGSTI